MTADGTPDPRPGTPDRPTAPTGRLEFSFPSHPDLVGPAVDRVMGACGASALPGGRARFALRVAVGEAIANAVLHGNGGDPAKRVDVEIRAGGDGVRVTVADEGEGFAPDAVGDPSRPGARARSRGRGLLLLRRLADEVHLEEEGSRVTLVVRP